jgi:GAF domain-containing protein
MSRIDSVDAGAMENDVESSLQELRSVLLGDHTVDSVLALVTRLSCRFVDGAVASSVTVRTLGQPHTSNYSNDLAFELDGFQYAVGRGPCVEALEKGIQVCELVADHDEWAEFSAAALQAGIKVVLATPLQVKGQVFGALNIYGADPSSFGDLELLNARVFAEQAGIVLTNVIALAGAETLIAQLREALDSRDIIGQAKGILMERKGITSLSAFGSLKKTSQRTNRKLFDVASELVTRVESRSLSGDEASPATSDGNRP